MKVNLPYSVIEEKQLDEQLNITEEELDSESEVMMHQNVLVKSNGVRLMLVISCQHLELTTEDQLSGVIVLVLSNSGS